MKAVVGLFLALLAPFAAAQSIVPTSGNGATIAPGSVANRVVFVVRDANGVPRPGMTVTFEATCTYRVRGDVGPYACVSVVPGEPLQVVSDSAGVVNSPLYQADGVGGGNAWIQATGNVDGAFVVVSFFWSVGIPKSPIALVSGSGQTVLVNQTAQAITARVIDDLGRGVPGVPVQFQFNCGSGAPCLLPAGPTTRVSNGSGLVDAGPRTANNVAGFVAVPALVEGSTQIPAIFAINIIEPARTATSKTRTGDTAFIRMIDAPTNCSITRMQPLSDTLAPTAPFMLAMPQGLIEIDIDNCPAGSKVSFSLQHPGGMPEGSRVWTARPTWQPRDSTNPIEGFWDFALTDGAAGDADGVANGSIRTTIAVAYGDPAAPNFQDLWWVGYEENGWGISIVQHGNVLFVIVFAYDAQGNPTWYVMPGGSWNAARDTYTGNLYSPRGRPLSEHVAANLVVGAPVGSLALRFNDTMTARAVMTFGNTEVIKFIKRQFFGVRDASVTGRYGDIWWAGPARSGWGFVLQQQYASMFALLFTYGTDGRPTWFTMPSITRTTNDIFEGLVFKTASSPWPAGYDPNQLVAPNVGAFRIEFVTGGATFDFTAEGRTNRYTISRQPF